MPGQLSNTHFLDFNCANSMVTRLSVTSPGFDLRPFDVGQRSAKEMADAVHALFAGLH